MTSSSNIKFHESNWLAKIGMVLIKVTDQVLISSLEYAWEEKEDNDKYYEHVIDVHRDIERVLRKCPDIKNIRWLGELRKEHFEPFDHNNAEEDDYFMVESSAFLSFEIFLPKSERRYAFDVRYDENVIEKAHVIYNGMFFLAFAEVDGEISHAFFGQEIREFLSARLNSKQWKGVIVPPCPLHPDLSIKLSSTSTKFEIATDEEDDIEVLLPLDEGEDVLEFLEYFLVDNCFSISHFLSACTIEQRMKRISWKIEEILVSLTDNYMNLLKLPWYRVLNKLSLMRSSRQMALYLQVECNDFAKYQLRLRKERESFSPQASETLNNTPFQNYCFRYLRDPTLSLSEIRETVKHMTNIVSEKYLQYSTVFAAIVGGIIGALITNIPFLISLISKWSKN